MEGVAPSYDQWPETLGQSSQVLVASDWSEDGVLLSDWLPSTVGCD